MAGARGNKGPELVRPLDSAAADRAGRAFAAAVAGDWSLAERLLDGLSADHLETVGSVATRLGRRASARSRHVIFQRGVAAWRDGRVPRPPSWDAVMDEGRRDMGTVRGPGAPATLFDRPPLTVIRPDGDRAVPLST